MDFSIFNSLNELFKKNKVTKRELLAKFYVESIPEFVLILIEFIDKNIEYIYDDSNFFNSYHLFLYDLIDICEKEDEIISVKMLINKNLKTLKDITKDYNKGIKSKDSYYNNISRVVKLLKGNKDYLDESDLNDDSKEEYKIIWFVITVLKTPDYLFRLLQVNPDYANLKDSNNKHLFINIIDYYVSNIHELDQLDILYFKRVITMMLESDKLRLSNDELFSLLESLEKSVSTSNIVSKRNIMFIINEIERHYEIINTDSRLNATDYCFIECPKEIILRKNDDRVDLTNLFTFSIDSLRGSDLSKILIDDAISIENTLDGIKLYVHVPDVDYLVNKDSRTDLYMRSIGESVYAKGYKKPMLDYSIANKCSLSQGNVRAAISFIIDIDFDGNVRDIDFKKSFVNVNYNLSRSYAEMFYAKSNDKALKKALHIAKYYATSLRKKRGETVGKIRLSSLIMEEFNIIVDLVVADYFKNKDIIFPYKNYLGKRSVRTAKHVSECENFNLNNNISPEGKNVLYSIFDIYNRVYYDTVPLPNSSFNGKIVGNVGNPMREYISLETNRLIKDVIISGEQNLGYWEERIERDCIEFTETASKIKELYNNRK